MIPYVHLRAAAAVSADRIRAVLDTTPSITIPPSQKHLTKQKKDWWNSKTYLSAITTRRKSVVGHTFTATPADNAINGRRAPANRRSRACSAFIRRDEGRDIRDVRDIRESPTALREKMAMCRRKASCIPAPFEQSAQRAQGRFRAGAENAAQIARLRLYRREGR